MQVGNRTRRIFVRTTVLIFAVVVLLVAFGWLEQERNKEEEYAVYSAYLSEGLLNDAHDWSTGGPVQVVISDRTMSGSNLRFRLFYLFDGRVRFSELHTLTEASYLVRNLFRTRIQAKFLLPGRATACLTADADYFSPEFQRRFPRNMGLVVLSGVGFNPSRSQAVFYINHFCGLCGGGRYVLMEKVSGVWHVRDEHYTWISENWTPSQTGYSRVDRRALYAVYWHQCSGLRMAYAAACLPFL